MAIFGGSESNHVDAAFLCLLQQSRGEEEGEKKEEEEEKKPDPLSQLINALSRGATKEQQSSLPDDPLYMSYAEIMSLVSSQIDVSILHNFVFISLCLFYDIYEDEWNRALFTLVG